MINKCKEVENIVLRYQSNIIDATQSLFWDIWNDIDDLILDIKETNMTKTEICDKLTQICKKMCE